MIDVIAWPPVGVVSCEWTFEHPYQSSRSLVTGADYRSAMGRRRRLATLEVSSLALGESGAGYMEMLKRLLAGTNAVRLHSRPINRNIDIAVGNDLLIWSDGDTITWRQSFGLIEWADGVVTVGTPTTSEGWPAVSVSGLPPHKLAARPGDFVGAYSVLSTVPASVAQVLAPAYADADGAATIRLLDALVAEVDSRIVIGAPDTAVFRPVDVPRAARPLDGDWLYTWAFREVFADEVGGFTEVNPWN